MQRTESDDFTEHCIIRLLRACELVLPPDSSICMYLFLPQLPLHHSLTCAHKVSALSIAEVMEDLVSVRLCHAGVDEETGVPQLCDLLGQQLYSLH